MRFAIKNRFIIFSIGIAVVVLASSCSTPTQNNQNGHLNESPVGLDVSQTEVPDFKRVLEELLAVFHAARSEYATLNQPANLIDQEVSTMAVQYLMLLRNAEMDEEFESAAELLQPYLTRSIDEIKQFPLNPPRYVDDPDAKLSDDAVLSRMMSGSPDFPFVGTELLSERETLRQVLEKNPPDWATVMPAAKALLESPFRDRYTVRKLCGYAVMFSVAGRTQEADEVYTLAV